MCLIYTPCNPHGEFTIYNDSSYHTHIVLTVPNAYSVDITTTRRTSELARGCLSYEPKPAHVDWGKQDRNCRD
jgi:hypothetical protein